MKIVKEMKKVNFNPLPTALVTGGRLTVPVTGRDVGGRNMEVALCAAEVIKGIASVVSTLETDGIDSLTGAVGAMVDGSTTVRPRDLSPNPAKYLSENDAYTFFQCPGDAFITESNGHQLQLYDSHSGR